MRDVPPKVKLNFRISSKVFERMQALVDNGEYEDISDVIVSALHQLLEKNETADAVEDAVIHYLDSDKGQETIRTLLLAEYRRLCTAGVSPAVPNAVAEPGSEYSKKDKRKQPAKVRSKKT